MRKESVATHLFKTLPNNKRGAWNIYGTLEEFRLESPDTKPSTIYTLRLNVDEEKPKDWHKSSFMLETPSGELKPYYVAGYSADETELYIYPISYIGQKAPVKMFFLTITGQL